MKLFLAWANPFVGARRRTARPAITQGQRPIPLTQAARRIVEEKPAQLRTEQKRLTPKSSERKTNPVESKKKSRSGRRAGGKPPKDTVVGHNDTSIPMGPVYFQGPQKNTVISHTEYDEAAGPPPPIEIAYEIGQLGSSKRLDEYKKMYKGSTFDLDTPTLQVGGSSANQNRKFRPSTAAGFGRKNVFWAYWLNDYYATTEAETLTCKTSCFNRSQIEDLLYKMWENVGMSKGQLNTFIDKLEETLGGDVRVDFPLDYIEVDYKYFNNNTVMPIDMSVYICMPKRSKVWGNSPMSAWFDPGNGNSTNSPELMLPDYQYEPVLTGAQNVMFTNTSGTASNIGIKANASSILTISTEVVPDATPQSFSVKFRRDWEVMTVQDFHLLPQQELKLTLRVKMSKMLDLKQLLAYDSTADKYQLFRDLTLFPMVTFQGADTTGVSKTLKRSGVTDMNRFLDTTAPRSGASMLSSSMTARARVHTKTVPLRSFQDTYSYNIGDILDVVSVSKRELFAYNDVERGEQVPYYQVNDNLGYFIDAETKPTSNYYLSQLVGLNLKETNSVLATNSEPTEQQLTKISTEGSWGVLESKSTSRTTVEKTGSDISK